MTVETTRTVVLTGAAGGMGRAFAKALVASGRRVALATAISQAWMRSLPSSAMLPARSGSTSATAAGSTPCRAGFRDAFRPVDVLINNAGHDIGGRTRFDQGSPTIGRRSSRPT